MLAHEPPGDREANNKNGFETRGFLFSIPFIPFALYILSEQIWLSLSKAYACSDKQYYDLLPVYRYLHIGVYRTTGNI